MGHNFFFADSVVLGMKVLIDAFAVLFLARHVLGVSQVDLKRSVVTVL